MSEWLTFSMGKHSAPLRTDRRYCRNHMWCQERDGVLRFGFSSYAIRLMKDVYFLDWCVNVGDVLAKKQQIGNIETSKAVSDLFTPLAGRVIALNESALADPSIINADGYEAGWLFDLAGELTETMSVQEYHDYLGAGWENTQRMLKAQVNAMTDELPEDAE